MDGTLLVAAGTAFLGSLSIAESLLHRRSLASIPIRVHVNGTRGKSGVTRLIAAGLRAGGIRTCAKTTGTLPRMIFPDGSEYPVFRPSRANVIEQLRIVRAAKRARAEALVVECMALQPALQSLCELKLIRATHGVITNARADHLDVMGPTVVDVASSLAGSVPVRSKLFTAEQKHLEVFRHAAHDRGSQLIEVGEDDLAKISWDDLERFPYIEHPDNVALALRVCQDVGVDRQTALQGMWQAQPDPGVMNVYEAKEAGKNIVFVNGFAANDPDSTGMIWEMIVRRYSQMKRNIAVVNCRSDRADRTEQLAEACVQWTPADHYLVVGSSTDIFSKRATRLGLDRRRITCIEKSPLPRLVETINRLANRSAMVMGMGNISGPGLDLVHYYHQRNRGAATSAPILRKAA